MDLIRSLSNFGRVTPPLTVESMPRKSCGMAAIVLLFLSCGAQADFYTCKDNAGHIITSDRPIPECAAKPLQVYQNNGVLKTEIAGPMTAEQRKSAELQEQQRSKEKQRTEEIKREQRYYTAHYPNEDAIEAAREDAIHAVESKITTETHVLDAATKALNQNQKALAATPPNQPARIHEFQLKIDDLNQSIQESGRLIHNYRAEEASINRQFDDTHKRYLEIVPGTKKP